MGFLLSAFVFIIGARTLSKTGLRVADWLILRFSQFSHRIFGKVKPNHHFVAAHLYQSLLDMGSSVACANFAFERVNHILGTQRHNNVDAVVTIVTRFVEKQLLCDSEQTRVRCFNAEGQLRECTTGELLTSLGLPSAPNVFGAPGTDVEAAAEPEVHDPLNARESYFTLKRMHHPAFLRGLRMTRWPVFEDEDLFPDPVQPPVAPIAAAAAGAAAAAPAPRRYELPPLGTPIVFFDCGCDCVFKFGYCVVSRADKKFDAFADHQSVALYEVAHCSAQHLQRTIGSQARLQTMLFGSWSVGRLEEAVRMRMTTSPQLAHDSLHADGVERRVVSVGDISVFARFCFAGQMVDSLLWSRHTRSHVFVVDPVRDRARKILRADTEALGGVNAADVDYQVDCFLPADTSAMHAGVVEAFITVPYTSISADFFDSAPAARHNYFSDTAASRVAHSVASFAVVKWHYPHRHRVRHTARESGFEVWSTRFCSEPPRFDALSLVSVHRIAGLFAPFEANDEERSLLKARTLYKDLLGRKLLEPTMIAVPLPLH